MSSRSKAGSRQRRLSNEWRHQIEDRPEVHDERYAPAYFALAVSIALQFSLPSELGPVGQQVLVGLELVLLVALAGGRFLSPKRREPGTLALLRNLTIAVIAVATVANLLALALLIRDLLEGTDLEGRTIILSALAIWSTNVVVFALWYWELDGGGPIQRRLEPNGFRDFFYEQMEMRPETVPSGWAPHFVDYLYLSFTNSTAFSPTDTLPLTISAKLLMMVQSSGALLTIALVAARAVNILR